MNAFLENLADRLAAAAARHGHQVAPPRLEPEVAQELLELARVTAHTGERRFAPLASYLAGMAAAGLSGEPGLVAAVIAEVRRELEAASPPPE